MTARFLSRNAGGHRPEPSKIKHPKLGACPSPSGRRWPEGPDEGQKTKSFVALPSPGASRHPLPEGEGSSQKQVLSACNRLKAASDLVSSRLVPRVLDGFGHRPPLQEVEAAECYTRAMTVAIIAVVTGAVAFRLCVLMAAIGGLPQGWRNWLFAENHRRWHA